ncbi:unnamed protein product [Caretta caretta]
MEGEDVYSIYSSSICGYKLGSICKRNTSEAELGVSGNKLNRPVQTKLMYGLWQRAMAVENPGGHGFAAVGP